MATAPATSSTRPARPRACTTPSGTASSAPPATAVRATTKGSTADADQSVAAPISGFVTKIGYAYGGDDSLRFVEITNPAIGYVARAFYVNPSVAVGQTLRLGETIGTVASLQSHYPGITDHVHLEVMKAGERLNAETLILARTIKVKASANG